MTPEELLRAGAQELGLHISAEAVGAFLKHLELIRLWRSKLNLTTLHDHNKAIVYHFLDSLTISKVHYSSRGSTLLDVGTGAGFPGLVLKSFEPGLDLTLLEKSSKKIVFLKMVCHELGFQGVTFLNMTLDSLARGESGSTYQAVVSRAFSSEPSALRIMGSLLAPKGRLIVTLGPNQSRTFKPPDGFQENASWEGSLPFSDAYRKVIALERS